jgi:hypothetical protein
MRWLGYAACIHVHKKCITFVSQKISSKGMIGRPRHKLMIILKKALTETGHEIMDWILLVTDGVQWEAFLNILMKLWVPLKKRNYSTVAPL